MTIENYFSKTVKNMISIQVKFKRLRNNQDLPLPQYESDLASGMDLRADIQENIVLNSLERTLIPTGLAMELPAGYEAQVRPRSGLALKKGISLVNAPGTIDADYRGEVGVILINLGKEPVEICRGDRIAQMVIVPVTKAQITEVQELNESQRGQGGFGSTGAQ